MSKQAAPLDAAVVGNVVELRCASRVEAFKQLYKLRRLHEANAELLEALQRLMRHFPTDSDLEDAGWLPREVAAACDAHDAARAARARALGQSKGE